MNFTLGVKFLKKRSALNYFEIQNKFQIQQIETKYENLKSVFLRNQLYNDLEIPFIKDYKLTDNTFCLFISNSHCKQCIKTAIEYYISNYELLPVKNFIILTDLDRNSISYIKSEYHLRCKFILTRDSDTSIDKINYPCYFMYNVKTDKTDMFLFPLKNEPEMMKKYFENVKSKYFAQNTDISHDEK